MSRGGRLAPAASLLVVLALVLGSALALARPASAAVHCVDGSADEARVAGSDEGPPKFTPDFFQHRMTIDASTDGLDQNTLPISIEAICGLPRSLDKQAGGLAGSDGVAVITSRTSVWKDGQRLAPARKLVELGGADTVTLRGRLLQQRAWKADEDGDPVPTFSASRITITD
jgi:hypothetical protein